MFILSVINEQIISLRSIFALRLISVFFSVQVILLWRIQSWGPTEDVRLPELSSGGSISILYRWQWGKH